MYLVTKYSPSYNKTTIFLYRVNNNEQVLKDVMVDKSYLSSTSCSIMPPD